MAMRGQGWLYDKQIKNRIYQERANMRNQETYQLEAQGYEQEEIPQILQQKAYEKRHQNDKQIQLPYERDDKVLTLGGSMHLGFDKAHITLSATKSMMQQMEQIQKSEKQYKATGEESPSKDIIKQQKLNEVRMKQRIQYDHIKDLHEMKQNDQQLKKSNYQNNYVFTPYMQQECDTQNFDYHQKKNDLKQYQEAYITCKKTLRK